MKTWTRIVFLICLFPSIVLLATARDSTLIIPYTETVPVIDGQLDPVWHNVTNTRMEKFAGDTYPDNWLDYYTTFRLMWDQDYLYLFMQFMDDTAQTDSPKPWENDGCELYIFTDERREWWSDIQWRYVYGETEYLSGVFDYGIGAWFDTEYGYNFELAIPESSLAFKCIPDMLIAFEIQGNDRDHGQLESMSKWWSSSNDSWLNPMLWGTAGLSEQCVSGTLYICHASVAPEIDGEMDEIWKYHPETSMNLYGEDTDLKTFSSWADLQFSYRVMWNPDGFFFFVDVIDDEITTDSPNSYENDGVELYFDAQNLKSETYVIGNDFQWRYVYGETEYQPGIFDVGTGAWLENDVGYFFELFIPADSLPFDLEYDHAFGWEVQVNDRDNGAREAIGKWWSPSNDSWLNPSLFGTAFLGCWDLIIDAVQIEPIKANSYMLCQNYPNPFNPTTEISYSLDRAADVKLVVYDVTGREITALVDGMQTSGNYKVVFDGSDLSSGVYFYKLEMDQNVMVKKMILVK